MAMRLFVIMIAFSRGAEARSCHLGEHEESVTAQQQEICNAHVAVTNPGLRLGRVYSRVGIGYAIGTVIMLPLVEARQFAALPLSSVLPAVIGTLSAFTGFRERHLFPFLFAHEVMNDICSDILAQAYTLQQATEISAPEKRLTIDMRRVTRSTSSAMLADDFPFLAWSRILHSAFLHYSTRLPASLSAVVTRPFTQAFAKMMITQLVYEPVSSGAYLVIQALLKGLGWRGAISEMRRKLYGAWRDGLVYWSLAHVCIFMIPYWWLQPLADNVATMFFNAYLSILSNDESKEG